MRIESEVNVMVLRDNDQTFMLSYRDDQRELAVESLWSWWRRELIDCDDLNAMLDHINAQP